MLEQRREGQRGRPWDSERMIRELKREMTAHVADMRCIHACVVLYFTDYLSMIARAYWFPVGTFAT